jgi:hypothetical protein
MRTLIFITTGTYNCGDYTVIRRYKNNASALRYLKSIGFPYAKIDNGDTFNYAGKQIRIRKAF